MSHVLLNNLLLATVLFLSTSLLTYLVKRYALQLSLIDKPNKRSSHSMPTPRGGGLALFLCFSATLGFLYAALSPVSKNLVELIIIGGAVIAIVGLLDDRFGVKSGVRFAVHSAACIATVSSMESLPVLQVFNAEYSLGWAAYPLYIVAAVWLLNLYNFMDGIDGIAAAEAVCVAVGAAVILYWGGRSEEASLLLLLALACLGFLVWNWPPAKIFMGDVGSGYLGFVFAVFALYTSAYDGISLWTWIVLLSIFWVDATATLTWRMFARQRWSEAHRDHLYQVMARKWSSHKKVTLAVIATNMLWVFPWALTTMVFPELAFLFVIICALPLLLLVFTFGLGSDQQ